MRRQGWQKRPPTVRRDAVPAFETIEHPDDYERRLEEMREEMHALDERWEREQRLTAHDFTGALPVVVESTARAQTTAGQLVAAGVPREHTSKEAT